MAVIYLHIRKKETIQKRMFGIPDTLGRCQLPLSAVCEHFEEEER